MRTWSRNRAPRRRNSRRHSRLAHGSPPPITGTPRMVRKRDDDKFIACLSHDDVVREAPENEPLYSESSHCPGHRYERHSLVFEKVQSGFDGTLEFITQSSPLGLVPCGCFRRFISCRVDDAYAAHYTSRMRCCIRRRSSARSTNFAVPACISASLRDISASQASAASGSAGASRLAMRSCASSARSSSGRFKASARSFFNVALSM